MGNPVGIRPEVAGSQTNLPPDNFYSPHSCANCHSTPGNPPQAPYDTPTYFIPEENLSKDSFLPSPSDCSAEIYWPKPLRVYQDFVQRNPYLRSQNYLDTLLASRGGQFPLQSNRSTLELSLALKGGVTFLQAPIKVLGDGIALDQDSGICAGPEINTPNSASPCAGLPIDFLDGDFGISLKDTDILSGQNLRLILNGWPERHLLTGFEFEKLSVQNGRLVLTGQLANNLVNSTLPWVSQKASPNPYDPRLWDFDITDLILKKITVAYDPQSRRALSYDEFLQNPDKAALKIVPYFLNFAKQGLLPERLSVGSVYEAVMELKNNGIPLMVPDAQKKDGPKLVQDNLGEVLQHIDLKASFVPDQIVAKNLFVDFSKDTGKNVFQLHVQVQRLKEAEAYLHAPIKIDRLYVPGKVDVTGLSADLEVILNKTGTTAIKLSEINTEVNLYGLQVEFGRTDYLQKSNGEGLFAILGGRIAAGHDTILDPLAIQPALKISGNLDSGYEVAMNLRLEDLQVRLPQLGEVRLSGDIQGSFRLKPYEAFVETPEGESVLVKKWALDPQSLKLEVKNLDLEASNGLTLRHASLTLTDSNLLAGYFSKPIEDILSLALQAPIIGGSDFQSAKADGALFIPRNADGHYDIGGAMLQPNLEVRFAGNKHDKGVGDWRFSLQGEKSHDTTEYRIILDGKNFNSGGALVSQPVQNFKAIILKTAAPLEDRLQLSASAEKIDLPNLQLIKPKMEFEMAFLEDGAGQTVIEIPQFGLSANPSSGPKPAYGLVRGPIYFKSLSSASRPLSLRIDRLEDMLELKNLNFKLGVFQIKDPRIRRATKGKISGIDIDGRLTGAWKMNYVAMTGRGNLSLVGDGEGDIHLRDSKGLRLAKPDPRDPQYLVETPMLSNTVWQLTRVDGIDVGKKRINGNFRLSTDIDPAIARTFGLIIAAGKVLNWKMNHDHLPYHPAGFSSKKFEYLLKKAAEEKTEEPVP